MTGRITAAKMISVTGDEDNAQAIVLWLHDEAGEPYAGIALDPNGARLVAQKLGRAAALRLSPDLAGQSPSGALN
ncbi:hypothetical protein GVN24_24595 [Rhizobium sp. CRIBSB]|nr:hypothetical protein [Rhizobium sp. CRIBSB]